MASAEHAPTVELLWWEGCPSWPQALAMLEEELEAAGLDPAGLRVTEIRTDAQASEEGFVGSPTIRINGRDIQPPRGEPAGLTCRVYRLRDGRISPLPDREDLREALRSAITSREGGG